jgi:hypothetical protein
MILSIDDDHQMNLFHYAAKKGDKHFTTMLIFEAEYLGVLTEFIDKKDDIGLTPFFYLCLDGYRQEVGSDPEMESVMQGI